MLSQTEIIFRLLLGAIVGGIIGFERQKSMLVELSSINGVRKVVIRG